ncbi:Lrp/AsnC family transcriptional regulator [Candidatus Woesearchaeota archaeon]|nr:Lrp/AsnC family transcriptional regulator [Candidatus Woesearchaeota archaeon]
MIGIKEFRILSNLRHNSREKLTSIAKTTNMPVSTVFDKIRRYEENSIIKRHISLLDFSKLGYEVDVCILLKVEKEEREKLREFLNGKECLNSIFKISNGYDFFVEGIFKDMQHQQDFIDEVEENFTLIRNDVFYIVNEMKREEFLNGKNN